MGDADKQGREPNLIRSDRPLWLLPEPVALDLQDRRPRFDGALDLGQCAERIETGWWDDFEVARDYYAATTEQGERLWIYREMYGARRWYLQGVFGAALPRNLPYPVDSPVL